VRDAHRSGKPSGHVPCAWAINGEKFQNFGLDLTACQYKDESSLDLVKATLVSANYRLQNVLPETIHNGSL
jgi:hypothetical protein